MATRITPLHAIAALALVLVTASCADDHSNMSFQETANYPIAVEPRIASLDVTFTTPAAGLMAQDAAHMQRFVAAYLEHGNGEISVVAPQGESSTAAIRYIGERLTAMGVPQTRILVGTDPSLTQVQLRFIAFGTDVAPCGTWGDVARIGDNMPMENLGCAVQHNIAAMVADPRDLIASRPIGSPDATRRNDALQKYETGQPATTTKTKEQSSQISDVQAQ